MATPSTTRPYSSSTPKNTSIATPTPMLPSPRPPTSAGMARNLSHKSPAMKTPASGHGHSHNISTSSHPSSTPLAATALGEDSLNFNSPAAMMMSSLGSHGLTPLPSGGGGLGISTELNNVSAGHGSVMGTRNPEEDKIRRIQEVVKLLRASVSGRGICREGVERIAQLAGLTHMWQGDTLAIAGTCVDLEIAFDSVEKNRAKDVVLKIFTPEAEEHKTEASNALKSNLEQPLDSGKQEPWRDLEKFAGNLAYLGKMDHLSRGINCFEAIDGLYHTFRKIWEREKQRMGQRRAIEHLSRGSCGRPVLNRREKLGLGVEYWAENRHFPFTRHKDVEGDEMHHDEPLAASDSINHIPEVWTADIDCEAGYPSLRISKDWIAESIWEDTITEHGESHPKSAPRIAWVEPRPNLVRLVDNANSSNAVDLDQEDVKLPKPPHVRFVINLDPHVLMPLAVASSVLNRQGLSISLDDSRFTTYNQALRNLATNMSQSMDAGLAAPVQRWNKMARVIGENGKERCPQHSYALYSAPQIWCYPVHSVAFDHPKHLAELLPTLRQYVLLWTLLRSVVPATLATRSADLRAPAAKVRTGETSLKRGIVMKTNVDPRRAKVTSLLQARFKDSVSKKPSTASSVSDYHTTLALPVDISLSLTSSTPPRPKLDLIWPLRSKLHASTSISDANLAGVSIEIGPNGQISVPSALGIPWAATEKGLRGIARATELGEDLGLLIEWIMEKVID